jgi:hypothetical protein
LGPIVLHSRTWIVKSTSWMLLRGVQTLSRTTTLVSPSSIPTLSASLLIKFRLSNQAITYSQLRPHSCKMAQAASTKVTQPEWQVPKPLVEEPVLKVYNSLTRKKASRRAGSSGEKYVLTSPLFDTGSLCTSQGTSGRLVQLWTYRL